MTNPPNSYEALLKQVWTDEDFKNRFIADPKAVLAEVGAKVPNSLKIEVHEDSSEFLDDEVSTSTTIRDIRVI